MKLGVLAFGLLMGGLSLQAQAQVEGCISTPDRPCTIQPPPGYGGGNDIDPNPYDPPGRPGRPPQPGRPGRPGHPGHPGQPPVYPPGPPAPPPHHGQQIQRTIYLNRTVNQYDVLTVESLLGAGSREFQGASLESILVDAQETGRPARGSLELRVNGYVEDHANRLNGVVSLMPRRHVELGRRGDQVEIVVQGRVHLRSITINARRSGGGGGGGGYPPYPGDFEVRQGIYQTYFGGHRLPLMMMLNLHQYRGHRVTSVIVRARSLGPQFATGTLLVNGAVQGGFQAMPFPQEFHLPVNAYGVIGRGIDSLQLDVMNLAVDEIVVRLAR